MANWLNSNIRAVPITALEDLPLHMAVLDEGGRIIYANGKWRSTFSQSALAIGHDFFSAWNSSPSLAGKLRSVLGGSRRQFEFEGEWDSIVKGKVMRMVVVYAPEHADGALVYVSFPEHPQRRSQGVSAEADIHRGAAKVDHDVHTNTVRLDGWALPDVSSTVISSQLPTGSSAEAPRLRLRNTVTLMEAPQPIPVISAELTILLVEDEPGVRQLTREFLEMLHYRVLEASNGEQAMQVATSDTHVDLLVTDVVMPGMSGGELARRFIARRPETAVLYLSGYTEEVVLHHGVQQRGVAFLAKPFTLEELSKKVTETLNARRSLVPRLVGHASDVIVGC